MQGRFLGFTNSGSDGVISTEDGSRYIFKKSEFNGDMDRLSPGSELDFLGENGIATQVFRNTSTGAGAPGEKSKIVAGLLAIFVGGFGIHKFYLGYNKQGVLMLVIGAVGLIFGAIPTAIMWIIATIEGVIYLTKSDDDFYYTYVKNQKFWF